jgi:hypothetical protein
LSLRRASVAVRARRASVAVRTRRTPVTIHTRRTPVTIHTRRTPVTIRTRRTPVTVALLPRTRRRAGVTGLALRALLPRPIAGAVLGLLPGAILTLLRLA